jgi:tetratricopeptide (TPR) repeat protein
LVAAVVLAYRQVWHAGFVWDDGAHVTRPDLRSWAGLARIWFEPGATQQYYPVLHSAFWVEHRLWGDSALGYHLANLLLHLGVTLLLYGLLRRLAVPGALLAVALFALHPVGVESVAWISEQKNTLSAVFYLGAALAYLRFDARRAPAWYAWAAGLFVLALLSKTVTATLPAALLVLFWWRRGRLTLKGDFLPILPLIALGVAAGAMTSWMESTYVGAHGTPYSLSLAGRFLVAGRALWFYLGKLLWPAHLTFIYPHWNVDPRLAWQWLFPAGILAAFAILYSLRAVSRAPLAAGLLFAGTLFPALGFINVFPFLYSYVADHFQYLASAVLFAAAAAGFALLVRRLSLRGRRVSEAAAAAVVVLLAILTWRQTAMYADMPTLWLTTIERNPECWMAYDNLGVALVGRGQIEKAVGQFQKSLSIEPENAEAQNNLGNALLKLDRPDEAVSHLERALALQPRFAQAENNLGNAWLLKGRADEAVAHYQRALGIDPRSVEALNNLGNVALLRGRTADAVGYYDRALVIEPGGSQALNNLGNAYLQMGRLDAAIGAFQKALDAALEADPRNTVARINLGKALLQKQRRPEAAALFEQAVAIDAGNAEAHFDLGNALFSMGRVAEATGQYETAVRIAPGFAEAQNNLGNTLVQTGQVTEAITHYQASLRSKPGNADVHRNLGAALVKAGRMDEAVTEFQEAQRLKTPQ